MKGGDDSDSVPVRSIREDLQLQRGVELSTPVKLQREESEGSLTEG